MFCLCREGRRRACEGAVHVLAIGIDIYELGCIAKHTLEACSVR